MISIILSLLMFISWVRIWCLGECSATMLVTFSISFFSSTSFASFILKLFCLVCTLLASLCVSGKLILLLLCNIPFSF